MESKSCFVQLYHWPSQTYFYTYPEKIENYDVLHYELKSLNECLDRTFRWFPKSINNEKMYFSHEVLKNCFVKLIKSPLEVEELVENFMNSNSSNPNGPLEEVAQPS